jgi:Uma2 family endonuclease
MNTNAIIDELEKKPSNSEQLSFDQLPAAELQLPAEPKPKRALGASRSSSQHKSAKPPSVTGRHQDVRLYLAVMFKTFVEMTDAGIVRDAPYEVLLGPGQFIEPDLLFIASSSYDRLHDAYFEGAPDLILEVLTEESTAEDRGEKFVLYEKTGVREYWLVDPLREMVNLYVLGPDDRYNEVHPDTSGRFRSRTLKGFLFDTDRLWKRVLPTTLETVEMVQAMIAQR